jgi:hypothetical protein
MEFPRRPESPRQLVAQVGSCTDGKVVHDVAQVGSCTDGKVVCDVVV